MTDTRWINETAARYGKGGDPSIHAMMKVAIDAERARCGAVALKVCREIGAAPGSSIDSAIAQIHREILYPQT